MGFPALVSPERASEGTRPALRVLIVPYPRTWAIEGGHRTQQMQTAVSLREVGAAVTIGDVGMATWPGWDIVHFFGDPRPLLLLGRPPGALVVSPVYFPRSVHLGPVYSRPGRFAMSEQLLLHRLRCLRHRSLRRAQVADFDAHVAAIAQGDVIVVNSHAEADLLRTESHRPLPDVRVVHSGVDQAFFHGDTAEGRRLLGIDDDGDLVLCVGRLEPRKNQLTLAKAMCGVPARLVLVGSVLPGNEGYLAACRAALPSLLHVPAVDHAELPHVYRVAGVHVLASWYETTGLSTLEAMAAGTPVVVGDTPAVEEYFGGCARVAKAGSVAALRGAILSALGGGRGCETEVASRYTWRRTAAELIEIYQAARRRQ